MKNFFNQINEIHLVEKMLDAPDLQKQMPQEVSHKGRSYSLYKVYARKLKWQERLSNFFECLIKTILSFGILLISADFREKWKSVFTGKMVQAIYLPTNHNEGQVKKLNPEVKDLNPDSELVTNKAQNIKTPNPSSESVKLENISLSSLLERLPIGEGLNPSFFNTEDNQMLAILVRKWSDRESVDKPHWTVEELATLLCINEKEIRDLFLRIQLFTGPSLPLNTEALNWLFMSIRKVIEKEMRSAMYFGVKLIWTPGAMVLGKENRFPKGVDKPFWKMDELSMFLAVKKESLIEFLKNHDVNPNVEGNYDSQEINKALKNADNLEINSLLEKNRLQQESLRFAI